MATNDPEKPPAGGADPSMEDILASIRRILSEEDQASPPPAVPEDPDDGVLMLDTSMMVPEEHRVPDPVSNPAPSEPEPHPFAAPAPPMAAPTPPPREAAETGTAAASSLVAPEAAAAAASSVGSLVRTLAAERGSAVHRGGPTIEDLVREELRPLLKTWLDTHLPPLVERLVQAEIERVVGRSAF